MAVTRRLDLALAELLDRGLETVDARLDVELARRGDEERDVAARDEVDDPLAHVVAGQVEILADVRQPVVRGIGVVAENRDAPAHARGSVGPLNAVRETRQTAMPAALAVIAGVERVDHLADVGCLRSRPLVAAAEQRARVLRRRRSVGTKNGFVVTWLTKTNFHFGCDLMKLSAASASATAPIAGVAMTDAGTASAAAPRPARLSS